MIEKQPVVAVAGDLDDGAQVEQGGIVDQNVDTAEIPNGGCDRIVDRGLAGDIEITGMGRRPDLGRGLFCPVQIDIGNDDGRTLAHVGFRESPADAACGTGNQSRPVLQTLH